MDKDLESTPEIAPVDAATRLDEIQGEVDVLIDEARALAGRSVDDADAAHFLVADVVQFRPGEPPRLTWRFSIVGGARLGEKNVIATNGGDGRLLSSIVAETLGRYALATADAPKSSEVVDG